MAQRHLGSVCVRHSLLASYNGSKILERSDAISRRSHGSQKYTTRLACSEAGNRCSVHVDRESVKAHNRYWNKSFCRDVVRHFRICTIDGR